jgi:hypothetical protein
MEDILRDESRLDEVFIAKKFVDVMKPLLQPGRLGIIIDGSPMRTDEKKSLKEIILLAKENKLSKSKKNTYASLTLAYEEPIEKENSEFKGNRVKLSINSLSYIERLKRIVIISCIICTMLYLIGHV